MIPLLIEITAYNKQSNTCTAKLQDGFIFFGVFAVIFVVVWIVLGAITKP